MKGTTSDPGHSGEGKRAKPHELTRRGFLLAGAGLFAAGFGGRPQVARAQPSLGSLDVFSRGYPHALYGRSVEDTARSGELTYDEFEKKYMPLDGIVGKVLNEAHYYTGKNNLRWFTDFKADHPSKMVLLHYNGTGRRVTDEALSRFFPGHFLYYRGTNLSGPVTTRTQTVLPVVDTSVFAMKRHSTSVADDIAVAPVGAGGVPDWERAEHVRLVRINRRDSTITVRRGLYGSRQRTFARGSYLAAHVTTGPYAYEDTPENNVPLWSYNFSSECPRDIRGRNCGDMLAAYLGGKLGPGGELETFDGIVFDVFSWVIRFGNPIAQIDTNTDGRADAGVIGGVNTVSLGVLSFFEQLRLRLPDKVLVADGHVPAESQRAFGLLNGMESEGYPDKYDFILDHLSKGENMFGYWKANSASPSLNFVNFRYKQKNPAIARNTFVEPNLTEDRSYEKMRLALASSLFTDTATTFVMLWLPPDVTWTETGTNVRICDELCKGTEQERHWLGQPLRPAVHLAAAAPDLFGGEGQSWSGAFVGRFEGDGIAFSRQAAGPTMAVALTGSGAGMSFALPGVEVPGADLFVSLRLRAEPLGSFPASVPRRVDLGAATPGAAVAPQNWEFTWAGTDPFEASFYFQNVGPGTVDLSFEVEGARPVYLERMTAHSATDGRYREYEGGIVFANPSTRSCTFGLNALFPGASLRRIRGSATQDPATNNGSLLGGQLVLPPKDGLFVTRSVT